MNTEIDFLEISTLIVTQHQLRLTLDELKAMYRPMWHQAALDSYAKDKGLARPSPLIQISRFEDGQQFIHDGHHRIASKIIRSEYWRLYPAEFVVRDWTYAKYAEINFAKGWVTPYDPRIEVRLPDFGDWKKEILEIAKTDPDLAEMRIMTERHKYCEPRRFRSVGSMKTLDQHTVENKFKFIASVLESHCGTLGRNDLVDVERAKIAERYHELTSGMSFGEAANIAKAEWLETYLKTGPERS